MNKTKTFKAQHLPKLLLTTFKSWLESEPFKISAVVAYYAILSLPALIIIILKLVGAFWGENVVRVELLSEIRDAIGSDAVDAIKTMIVNQSSQKASIFATLIGVGTLIFGATGVFNQLKSALDAIWEKEPEYKNSFIATIMGRVKSFGFILILGFILLTSLILTSILSMFSKQLNKILPGNLFDYLFLADFLVSLAFIYALFATMFKYLPAAKITWKSVKVGAALTTFLFLIGKYLLALYFNKMEPGSAYGAAGSIILIMLWVSYSNLILLFGAHFTKHYADKYVVGDNISS